MSVVGIDLGTSNSVLASAEPAGEGAEISVFGVPQATGLGQIESLQQLPSFLYIPAGEELPQGALALPWEADPRYAIGALAREQGGKVPHRLVSSAKSWLCHDRVDRRGKILPFGRSEEAVPRISPLQASGLYLRHLRRAWEHAGGTPFAEQEVVLTVPASFDPAARDLTLESARAAGLANTTLLEEPTAALYAWLESAGDAWRDQLAVGDAVLVCDVGGGTTDFSLIAVSEADGALSLERIAVGEHILLGGDNMDWALAFALEAEIEAANDLVLDAWQLTALVLQSRAAKEALLNDAGVEKVSVVIPNRGAKFFKRTLKADLTAERIYEVVTDGFFPRCEVDARPARGRRAGLTQMGLPYASDAGITRHLAAFLAGAGQLPTAVLFNGGVLKADPLRTRLLETLDSWLSAAGRESVRELEGGDPDKAVARGAAWYGWVRRGKGVRIRSGTARSYYVGVEQPMPAVPGFEPPVVAVCVAPFGMEEGSSSALDGETFGLVVGEPASFRFFASSTRKDDDVGARIEDWEGAGLRELPPIETLLTADDEADAGQVVEVRLEVAVTTTGTLALECAGVGREDDARWKLEFSVRGDDDSGE